VSKSARTQCYINEQSISIQGTSLSERMSRATRLKWNKLNRKRMLRTCSPKDLSGSSSTLSVESWDVELRGCVGSHANAGVRQEWRSCWFTCVCRRRQRWRSKYVPKEDKIRVNQYQQGEPRKYK